MKQTMKILIPLAIVFAFLVATNFIYAAWSAPAGAPSAANNAPAPINVGVVDQVKNAALGVDGLAVFGTASVQTEVRSPRYCDISGGNCMNLSTSSNNTVGVSNIQAYTTPGSYTYTVPSGVNTIRVEVAGAGGGGGSGSLAGENGYSGKNSEVTGPSFTIVGVGGTGGVSSWDNGSVMPGEETLKRQGKPHVSGFGGDYALEGKGGAGGMGGSSEYQTVQYDALYDGHTGNNGGLAVGTFSVTPFDTYVVTVGAGGNGAASTSDSGGAKGGNGYVLIYQ